MKMCKKKRNHNLKRHEEMTRGFYDLYTPEYSPWHIGDLLDFVVDRSSASDSLLDVGCGNGSVLELFRERTPLRKLVGIDISPRYLEQAALRGFKTCCASILDPNLSSLVGGEYSYILASNLLHHLVGPTRSASKANVRKALVNAFNLLRPGGYLLIHELVFSPALVMDIVFWVKRFVTLFTSSRLSSFSSWHNLGAPVVSYLGAKELERIIQGIPGARIVMWQEKPIQVTWLMRLALIRSAGTVACMVDKTSK